MKNKHLHLGVFCICCAAQYHCALQLPQKSPPFQTKKSFFYKVSVKKKISFHTDSHP